MAHFTLKNWLVHHFIVVNNNKWDIVDNECDESYPWQTVRLASLLSQSGRMQTHFGWYNKSKVL